MLDAATLEVLVTQEDLLALLACPEATNTLAVELKAEVKPFSDSLRIQECKISFGAPSLSVEAVNYN